MTCSAGTLELFSVSYGLTNSLLSSRQNVKFETSPASTPSEKFFMADFSKLLGKFGSYRFFRKKTQGGERKEFDSFVLITKLSFP